MTISGELLAHLRLAREGSARLDARIGLAIDQYLLDPKRTSIWRENKFVLGRDLSKNREPFTDDEVITLLAGTLSLTPYTRNVHEALTLIPEDWSWTLYSDGSGEIHRDVPKGMLPGAPGSTTISFFGNTLPLSICIGALSARLFDKEKL